MDDRVKLADVFKRLQDGKGPVWVSWQSKRYLLRAVDAEWLERGVGVAIVATRRGYRRVELIGRTSDGGFAESKRGRVKHQPLRTNEDYFKPFADKRVRAIVVQEHELPLT